MTSITFRPFRLLWHAATMGALFYFYGWGALGLAFLAAVDIKATKR
jgi:hypothetical protein